MKNIRAYINEFVPSYCIIPLIFCFVWNTIVYNGTRIINSGRVYYDITMQIDRDTPFIPEFIVVYLGCFITWTIYYIMCGRVSREYCAKFVAFDLLTRLICAIIFIAFPTCNVRPSVEGVDIFEKALICLYNSDAPNNLFPSIHCIVSWNCFVGLRNAGCYKNKTVVVSFIMAILVFISTVVLKQHVMIDLISAIIVSELCWCISKKLELYRFVLKVMEKINFAKKI